MEETERVLNQIDRGLFEGDFHNVVSAYTHLIKQYIPNSPEEIELRTKVQNLAEKNGYTEQAFTEGIWKAKAEINVDEFFKSMGFDYNSEISEDFFIKKALTEGSEGEIFKTFCKQHGDDPEINFDNYSKIIVLGLAQTVIPPEMCAVVQIIAGAGLVDEMISTACKKICERMELYELIPEMEVDKLKSEMDLAKRLVNNIKDKRANEGEEWKKGE